LPTLDIDDAVYRAFQYHNLGSLVYIGNSAVFDWGGGWNVFVLICGAYRFYELLDEIFGRGRVAGMGGVGGGLGD